VNPTVHSDETGPPMAELLLTRADILLLKNGLLELVSFWPQEVEQVTGLTLTQAEAVNDALRDELLRHDEEGAGDDDALAPVRIRSGPRVGSEKGAGRRAYLSPDRYSIRMRADFLAIHLSALAFVAEKLNERSVDARLASTKQEVAALIAELQRPGSTRRPA
jgi:hypothetical protein